MKAVIIDDEVDGVSGLAKLIDNFVESEVSIEGTANNLIDGIQLVQKVKPDVVFLDIEMPVHNGLSIYKFIPEPDFQIVFTTAYSEYAIEAIKKNAADYLLKPVNFIELSEAIKKVGARIKEKQQFQNLETQIKAVNPISTAGENIMFPVCDGFVIENSNSIEYCYAEQAYSVVVLYSGRKMTVSKSLKDLALMLPEDQFYRTHKSYLININYIRKFVRGQNSFVHLHSGEKIPVAVRNVSAFASDIQKLIKK